MRMNTSDNYESCVCFSFLTGPCLQSNLELGVQGKKTRALRLSSGWKAKVNGHRGMPTDTCTHILPVISDGMWCPVQATEVCFLGLGFGRCSCNSLYKWGGHC